MRCLYHSDLRPFPTSLLEKCCCVIKNPCSTPCFFKPSLKRNRFSVLNGLNSTSHRSPVRLLGFRCQRPSGVSGNRFSYSIHKYYCCTPLANATSPLSRDSIRLLSTWTPIMFEMASATASERSYAVITKTRKYESFTTFVVCHGIHQTSVGIVNHQSLALDLVDLF